MSDNEETALRNAGQDWVGADVGTKRAFYTDAQFLRMYATAIRNKTERTIDIPSVMAGVFDGMADRVERQQQALQALRVLLEKVNE